MIPLVNDLCLHFGTCGGCTLQDMAHADYMSRKKNFITDVLERHAIDKSLDDFITCGAGSRRRVTFAFERYDTDVDLGFHQSRTHTIVPVKECLIAAPQIIKALPDLRQLLTCFRPKRGTASVSVLATDSGLDIALDDVGDIEMRQRERAADIARAAGFARLSMNGDILVQFRPPVLPVGHAQLTPPPGGFVQAVAAAETAMAEIAIAAFKASKAKHVADLFSGSGAFALRLAEIASVHAVESDAKALAALSHASRHAKGLKQITQEKRDLFRRPLLPHELNTYEGVLLDPPRQGAIAQIEQLCKASVPCVVYVSCRPESFARDASRLIAAGYVVETLVGVDQFLWSDHIELVCVLKRPKKPRKA